MLANFTFKLLSFADEEVESNDGVCEDVVSMTTLFKQSSIFFETV